MKKTLCCMLAALLACLPLAALGEKATKVDTAVIDAFSDTWVGLETEGYAAEIWYEKDAFRCTGTRFISVGDGYSFEFERCEYDADGQALVCEGGVLLHETYSEPDDRIVSQEVAAGFGARLTLDEKRHLHWTGSGDAIPDQVFASLDEVGEESWYDTNDADADTADDWLGYRFVGDWMCDRASIYIDRDDAVYTVRVTWGSSAFEEVFWAYSCTLDEAAGALSGKGRKWTETYDDGGNVVSSVEEYADGAATFTLDGDALLWNDAREDAAQGMRFLRAEPEGDGEDADLDNFDFGDD